jgi:hypothetical protein
MSRSQLEMADIIRNCGSLVLHVWKHMSISVQREGTAADFLEAPD